MAASKTMIRRLRLAGIAVLAAVALATLLVLAMEVSRKLNLLGTASSDNVQWTLSQTEVEFLEIDVSVMHGLRSDAPDLATIRREFDIFYSRVQTISESALYAELRLDPDYAGALESILGFLQAAVEIVDAPDATFAAALPDLDRLIQETRPDVRTLSVAGLGYFARQADIRREGVAVTLLRLAAATLVLLSGLVATAMFLARLNRLGERRSNELQLASGRLSTVVSTSLDAILVADRDGTIVEFNPAAEAIFGHHREDVIGRQMGDVVVPEKYRAAHEAGMARYRETGEKRVIGKGRLQLEAQRADGTLFPVELSIQSAEGDQGELFVSFVRDISKRLAAERELVEARDQAVAGEKAKTEFLAVMSHEIRTPVNGLLGSLSLMKDTRLTAKQRGYLENMEASGHLLLRHANDVLDITKHDAGKLVLDKVQVDPGELVQSVVDNQRDLAAASNNTIEWAWCSDPVETILTDPFRLRQVLINLVSNAVKFTRDGRVSIELEAERIAQGAARIDIRVIDTGIGIAPEDIDRLFDDFETGDASYGRETGGTGLGLGIARRLTSALGGEIGAESTPGAGSVFWISFQADTVAADAPAPETPQPVHTGSGPRKSVLIIEDNEINRLVLREQLQADGHSVKEAENGRIGVRMAGTEKFDVILMDISMPVMDGIAATKAIRAGTGPGRDVPIFAVTAHAMPTQIEEFRAAGMDGFLSKPIDRARLRDLLAKTAHTVRPGRDAPRFLPEPGLSEAKARLDDLRTTLGAANLRDLLTRFRAEGDEFAAHAARHDASARIAQGLPDRAHKLAGSAAALGFDRLQTALNSIETRAKTGGSADLEAELAAFARHWDQVRQVLAQET